MLRSFCFRFLEQILVSGGAIFLLALLKNGEPLSLGDFVFVFIGLALYEVIAIPFRAQQNEDRSQQSSPEVTHD